MVRCAESALIRSRPLGTRLGRAIDASGRSGRCDPSLRICLRVAGETGTRLVHEREGEALCGGSASSHLPGATGALSESTADAGGISVYCGDE